MLENEKMEVQTDYDYLTPISLLDIRILTFYEDLKKIFFGEIPPPRMAIIYPVYGCNLNCIGCEYESFNKNTTILDFRRFKTLLDELHQIGVQGIEFCGGGEPTLYPQFLEILNYGANLGFKFGLITNGTMEEDLTSQIPLYLSYMRITINSSDEEMYRKFQKPKGNTFKIWEVLLNNICEINKIRKEHNSKMVFGMKVVLGKTNESQLEEMVEFAISKGFDNIQFKLLKQSSDSLDEKKISDVENRIRQLKSEYHTFKIIYNTGRVRINEKCLLTPLQTTIDAYGNVYLCCYFSYRKENHIIGNIYREDFKNIWFGEKHKEKISEINPNVCNLFDCRFMKYHKIIDELIMSDKGQFQFI